MATYFSQPCPICGRSLEVRVQYLGRNVVCRHCHGEFEACDPESTSYPPESSGINLLERVEKLLNSDSPTGESPRRS